MPPKKATDQVPLECILEPVPKKYCLCPQAWVNFHFRMKKQVNVMTKPQISQRRPFFFVFFFVLLLTLEFEGKNRDPHHRTRKKNFVAPKNVLCSSQTCYSGARPTDRHYASKTLTKHKFKKIKSAARIKRNRKTQQTCAVTTTLQRLRYHTSTSCI